jgi:toxin CptA
MRLRNEPISLQPAPSRRLYAGLVLVHVGALLALLPVSLPWWCKALVMFAVLADAVHAYQRHVLLLGDDVTAVTLFPDGRWMIKTRYSEECQGEPVGERLVQAWLTVLVFRLADGRRRALILLPDNVEAKSFRRLRVRLRYPRKSA